MNASPADQRRLPEVADLDTRTLGNGRHRIAATTASGATTSHVVRVNNAPAGAPRISPTDGTLVAGDFEVPYVPDARRLRRLLS